MSEGNDRFIAWLPWRDTRGAYSWLRALVFAAMFGPFFWMVQRYMSGAWDFPSPYVNLVYHSGVWATVILLTALAITPARSVLRAGRLIQVRRMLGLGALAYTLFHILCWFALRDWDFPEIWNEAITRVSLIVASLSTLGMVALGITSTDGALRSMGAQLWTRLHRHVYWVTGLAVLHYLMSPIAVFDWMPYTMLGIYIWLIGWRLLARSSRRGTDPRYLSGLALASALTIFLFQPIWTVTFHTTFNERTIQEIMFSNFDLSLWPHVGMPAIWWILAIGLAVALVAPVANWMRARRTAQS